jgi:glycosyltransferase involved in cell wall biosynthesis
VADQLVIGWYAMFAMEAMATGRPVFCFLRPDLIALYSNAGVLNEEDMPIINSDPLGIKDAIRSLVEDKARWREVADRSRAFVEKYHSTTVMSLVFAEINSRIGVPPSAARN